MRERRKVQDSITPGVILIPLGIGVALFAVVFGVMGGFSAVDSEAFWRALCDALTVPGVLMTGAGLLSLISGAGAFDGLSFTTRKAFGQVLREERREEMPKTYYDYVAARKAKQRTKPRTMLYVGLGFLALALICLVYYQNTFPA